MELTESTLECQVFVISFMLFEIGVIQWKTTKMNGNSDFNWIAHIKFIIQIIRFILINHIFMFNNIKTIKEYNVF